MKLKSMLIGAGAVLTVGAASAKDYTIKPKYNVGDNQLIEMTSKMDMAVMGQNMKMSIGMTMGQETKAHDKGYEVAFGFERVLLDMNMMGQNIKYDSNMKNGDVMWQQMDKAMRPLLKAELSVVLDKDGKALETKEAKIDPALKQMGMDVNDLVANINQQLKMLPDKPVAVGHDWDADLKVPIGQGANADAKVKVTFAKVEQVDGDDIAHFSFKGTFKAKVKQMGMEMDMKSEKYEGVNIFNITKGTFVSSNVDMIMNMNVGGQGQMKATANTKMTMSPRKKIAR